MSLFGQFRFTPNKNITTPRISPVKQILSKSNLGSNSNLVALWLHGQHKSIKPTKSKTATPCTLDTVPLYARCTSSKLCNIPSHSEINPVIVVYFTPGRAKYVNHYALHFKRKFNSANVCIPTETYCHRRPPCCITRDRLPFEEAPAHFVH